MRLQESKLGAIENMIEEAMFRQVRSTLGLNSWMSQIDSHVIREITTVTLVG